MGKVILDIQEYDRLKKQAEYAANCFELGKGFGGEVHLSIKVSKAQEIFKSLFSGSKYDDGTYTITEKESDYNESVANYHIKAIKNPELAEEVKELPLGFTYEEDKENGN